MEKTRVHVVVHTHWDREWYQPFEEFRARLVRLVDGLLDILETEPDFTCFMLDGQTVVLDDYLELRPENEARLRCLAEAGRLLVGPWYVLPDEVLVSGESLLRNLGRGIRRARDFGGAMPVGYVPDQFSHTIDLPTVFRGFGLETACLWRGVGAEVGTQAFRWRSPSGATVLVAYLATSYSNASAIFDEPKEMVDKIGQAVKDLEPFAVAPVCLLMNGTDHQLPTPGAGRMLAAAGKGLAQPVILSSLPAYVAELRKELGERVEGLPLVRTELRSGLRAPVLVGTFSSRIRQKQRNWRLESLLTRAAEPVGAMAWLVGATPYPRAELDYAWKLLLQNHPHDSICGCSVDVVHREIETRYDKAEQVAGQALGQSLAALAAKLSPGPGVVTVVNADPTPAEGLVEVSVPEVPDLTLLDAEGRRVPVQPVAAGTNDILYDMVATPGQLRAFLPFISGRKVQGMYINAIAFSRPIPEEVRMEAVIGDRLVGELDWEAGKAEVARYLADRSVKRFHIVARRSPERRIAFVAGGVPGLGWKQYRLVWASVAPAATPASAGAPTAPGAPTVPGAPTAPGAPDAAGRAWTTGSNAVENDFYRVAVNPDGTLDVTRKDTGRTLRGLNQFVDGGDRGDLYTYCPPEHDTVVFRPARPAKVRVVESGPARATLEISAIYRLPPGLTSDRSRRQRTRRRDKPTTISTRVSLIAHEPLVRLETSFDNIVSDHRLQAVFPLPEPFGTHYALSHFSIVERPAREPVDDPAAWSEPPSGIWPHRGFFGAGELAVLAKGLPEYTVVGARQPQDKGRALALTLVRGVGWLSREDLPMRPGHAGPGVETPEGQCLGQHRLEYALAVTGGGGEGIVSLQRRYSGSLLGLGGVLPPEAPTASGSHSVAASGTGPGVTLVTHGLLELAADTRDVSVSAVKQRDPSGAIGPADDETLVVRLVNYSGQPATVTFGAADGVLQPSAGVAVLDHAERPVAAGAGGPATGQAGEASLAVGLGPWEVATFGLRRPG